MGRIRLTSTIVGALALLMQVPVSGIGQQSRVAQHARAFEKNDHVIYEDPSNKQTDLGRAFNPILRPDGRVVMIRGSIPVGGEFKYIGYGIESYI
jgi:hypothetical protein